MYGDYVVGLLKHPAKGDARGFYESGQLEIAKQLSLSICRQLAMLSLRITTIQNLEILKDELCCLRSERNQRIFAIR